MKKYSFALALFFFLPSLALCGTKKVNVQGKLTNSTGTPLTGSQTLTFRLYDVSTATVANAIWIDTMTVTVSSGIFNVALGSNVSLDSLPFNKTYYLGMQVSGDANEMSPRQTLAAAPYALGSVDDFRAGKDMYVTGNFGVGATTLYSKLQARPGTDRNFGVEGPIALSSGVTLNIYNDAHSGNVPLEVRASTTVLGVLGNVGIGTTSPQTKLDVTGYVNISGANQLSGDVAGTKWYVGSFNNPSGSIYGFSKPATYHLAINASNGYIGIGGITSPAYLLDAGAGSIRGNIISPSDENLKKNILTLPAGTLDKVIQLSAKSFEWDRDNIRAAYRAKRIKQGTLYSANDQTDPTVGYQEGPQVGLIAQDVEALFPQLVLTDSDGIKSISYMGVTAVLVNAIKEQQKEIDALKLHILALEKK